MKNRGGRRGQNNANDPRTRAPASAATKAAKAAAKELQAAEIGMPVGRRNKLLALIRTAEKEAARDRLTNKWRPWEGTPQTHEHIASVPVRRRQSSLDRMHVLGKISAEDLASAQEISGVIEMIERAANVSCASLEARVDYAGSARDALIESLGRVRLEVAYRAWRKAIPVPRRMIIDMVVAQGSYVLIASRYRMHWRTARRRLISALQLWPECKSLARAEVKREDLAVVYARLGEGVLLAPRPRAEGVINPNSTGEVR